VPNNVPYGFTASWSAPTLTATGTLVWTLKLTGSAAAVPTVSQMVVAVTAGVKTGTALSARVTVPTTVLAPPTLAITSASSALTLVQGKSVTDLFSLAGNASYSGAAAMSITGLPTGMTATWSASSVPMTGAAGTSTLTLAGTSATVVGTYSLTVTATGDGLTVTKGITVQVVQAPAVQLTIGTPTLTFSRSAGGTESIATTVVGGLSSAVTLSVTGLPAGVSATFARSSFVAPGTGTTTLTFTCAATAKAGASTITILATPASGASAVSHTVALTLQ
jgi:hypothetical protein